MEGDTEVGWICSERGTDTGVNRREQTGEKSEVSRRAGAHDMLG